MLLLAIEQLCGARALAAPTPEAFRQWQMWKLAVGALVPGTWVWFSVRYARAAQPVVTRRMSMALVAAFGLPAVLVIGYPLHLVGFAPVPSSPDQWELRLGWSGTALSALLLMSAIAVVLNLERTFRASVGTIRWRIKFILLGVGVIFVTRVYLCSQALVFRALAPSLDIVNAAALIAATPLILRSFLRAGHFETQVYPSQAVLQNSLTVLLAGIYLLVLAAFARIAAWLGGDAAFALKAFAVLVALVGLAVLLQSDRFRLRLRLFVSRNFRRPIHDYRAVWTRFTDATASRLEAADLSRALVTLTADTFNALSVTLWLVDERDETLSLAASTARSGRGTAAPSAAETREVLAHLRRERRPFEIESSGAAWAVTLRGWHPAEFANGGGRVCVPLVGRARTLGLLVVGDRINGIPFSSDDFDLLECVGAHAAASLANVQLSRDLLQLKELEAFQAMAAFFVHDLKNAASTLTLMLQNLPVHFDDPAFRADTLRGIGNTAGHIDRLIRRLSLLRHELKIELIDADLNEVVADAIAGLEKPPGGVLVRDIRPVPRIPLDADQLKKVIVNLVLNAAEASPRDGEIRVGTSVQDGWVVLTVQDNGCGMTDEFLSHALFRPFQTTKKSGLGIGMFQSKMIVEAHGGRIAVASEPGKGTRFEVFLRMAPTTRTAERPSVPPTADEALASGSFQPSRG